MKKKILIVGIVLTLFALGLMGCTDSSEQQASVSKPFKPEARLEDKFLGTWNAESGVYNFMDRVVFREGGQMTYFKNYASKGEQSKSAKWEIQGDALIVSFQDINSLEFKYQFKNDQTLVLTVEKEPPGTDVVVEYYKQ